MEFWLVGAYVEASVVVGFRGELVGKPERRYGRRPMLLLSTAPPACTLAVWHLVGRTLHRGGRIRDNALIV